jgi:hypothetical protein
MLLRKRGLMTLTPYKYSCGAFSGQQVRLKRDESIVGSDRTYHAGEIWTVRPGNDPALEIREFALPHRADGGPHVWSASTFWETFESVA